MDAALVPEILLSLNELLPYSFDYPNASQLGELFSVSLIFGDVSVVFDPQPVFMLNVFMADLAEPLKHD